MQDAAGGVIVSPHVFGGELRRDGRAVVAEGVPANSCNEVGWVLGRQGPITVNGVLLPRLTASSLAELCRGNDAGASLSWSPRE